MSDDAPERDDGDTDGKSSTGTLSVVNVVGSGTVGVEIDLHAVASDLVVETRYEPDQHTGMHIRLDDGALITLYRTGSYHIVGVDSRQAMMTARDRFLELLDTLNIPVDNTDSSDSFSIRNIVCTADLERTVNLNAVAIGIGLEHVEYEPEQFPGLVYRVPDPDAVVLIFGSGKLVITGVVDTDTAAAAYNTVTQDINRILNPE